MLCFLLVFFRFRFHIFLDKIEWQFHACVVRNNFFATHSVDPIVTPGHAALRLSQCGPCASQHLRAIPVCRATTFDNSQFRTLLLLRLRLPLQITNRQCRCKKELDCWGDHASACHLAGMLDPRGAALEVIAARICSDAGARVQKNVFLRDLNLTVLPSDGRRIEVIANALPLFMGVNLLSTRLWSLLCTWLQER